MIPFQRLEGCISGEVRTFYDNYSNPKKLNMATNQILIIAWCYNYQQDKSDWSNLEA